MRAAIYNKYGAATVLQVKDIASPKPCLDEVLVRVHASSVNPIDWKIRNGFFLLRLIFGLLRPRKKILGVDFAGEIVGLGTAVTKFNLHDKVFGATSKGAYAEYVCVNEANVSTKPKSMSFQEAAGVPLAGLTALQALRDKGGIRPNDNVLIYGASGGVGTFAVQLARSLGANVTGVCSKESIQLVKSLGAQQVIDRASAEFTLPERHYNIIFDAAGKAFYARFKRSLKQEGKYIASTPQARDLLPLALTFLGKAKAKTLITRLNGEDLVTLSQTIEKGSLRTVVDSVYPLTEIVAAHQYAEQSHSKGKVILEIAHND
jgi:NADPH:quinone reductase-like Zn-dependent oxidoreductase